MYTQAHVDLYSKMGLVVPDNKIVITKDILKKFKEDLLVELNVNRELETSDNLKTKLLQDMEAVVINSVTNDDVIKLRNFIEKEPNRIAEFFKSAGGKQIVDYVVSELFQYLEKETDVL